MAEVNELLEKLADGEGKVKGLQTTLKKLAVDEAIALAQLSVVEEAFLLVMGLGNIGSSDRDIDEFRKNTKAELEILKTELEISQQLDQTELEKDLVWLESLGDIMDQETNKLCERQGIFNQHNQFLDKLEELLYENPKLEDKSTQSPKDQESFMQKKLREKKNNFLFNRSNILPTSSSIILLHPNDIGGSPNKRRGISTASLDKNQAESLNQKILMRQKHPVVTYFEAKFQNRIKIPAPISNSFADKRFSVKSLNSSQVFNRNLILSHRKIKDSSSRSAKNSFLSKKNDLSMDLLLQKERKNHLDSSANDSSEFLADKSKIKAAILPREILADIRLKSRGSLSRRLSMPRGPLK